jgi:ABC-type glycerol-3-phosphate transport system permease component
MKKKSTPVALTYCCLFVFVVIAGFPFLWMLSTSLKDDAAIFSIPPRIIPKVIDFNSYNKIWQNGSFFIYFFNSFKVASVTTVLAMIISIMAGLGFGRFTFPGRGKIQIMILFAQLFPLVLLVTPYYTIMRKLGIINTHRALYLAYTSFVVPFSVWMLTNYFKALPKDLEEAAMIDGCSRLRSLVVITLPLSAPGIVATSINAFILAWNEFLFAQTFIDSSRLRTLPIGLKTFMNSFETEWNLLMAGAVISTIPVVLLFIFLQKQLVNGLTSGAVKG